MSQKCRVVKAFTLVELLVVIAIVSLLIAILLPLLSKARATAQVILCAANERQVFIGLALYNTDYDGWMPDATTTWTGSTWVKAPPPVSTANDYWRGYQNKLVYGKYVGDWDLGQVSSNVNDSSITVFSCPMDLNHDSAIGIVNRVPVSFVPNIAHSAPGLPNVGAMGLQGFGTRYVCQSNIDLYQKPSDYFMFVEVNSIDSSFGYGADQPRSYVGSGGYSSNPLRNRPFSWDKAFNHALSNVAFADGHVLTMDKPDMAMPSDDPDGRADTDNWLLNSGAYKIDRF